MGSNGPGGVLLQVVPALIGAFVGAPVLARELETGTFRFAWTQGFGRWRWALAKLVAARGRAGRRHRRVRRAGVLVLPAGVRHRQPGPSAFTEDSPLVTLFSLREVTFPAWTLAAFAIGALAGMLIRRVVPAIVATLAVYAGLVFATAGLLREHYLTPLVTSNNFLPGASTAWIISQWSTKDGRFAFAGNPPGSLVNQFCSSVPARQDRAFGDSRRAWLSTATRMWTSYQPASRFWPFQWIEGGWLLALSALLIAATVWLVQHRAA